MSVANELRTADRGPPLQRLPRLLVDARAAARMLAISARHLEELVRRGEIPPPHALGRCKRWVVYELEECAAKGCPATQGINGHDPST